ncbi:S6 family peptidase [Moraxella sp.]|uniref:S6 family peptidase n=1 Tax=Moraxella sp. TaxID=479 RepID=UPI0026DAFDEC|nr:S6 family peptidase [Moraxella sp.]MDO4894819.1 S6 family peptidase [Moraxella sp.]
MKIKRTLLATAIASAVASSLSHASSIRQDIDLQTYRDFAENKGEFVAGATDIVIRNKNGDIIGNLLPAGVPVPDFSAANAKSGVVTLISPQLTGTVQHNPTYVLLGQDHQQFAKDRASTNARNLQLVYDGLSFGANDSHHAPKNHYFVVKRNDLEKDLNVHGSHAGRYPRGFNTRKIIKTEDEATSNDPNNDFWSWYGANYVYDLALPRLHKLVTETAPTPTLNDLSEFKVENYGAFVHVGSGVLEKVDPSTGDPISFNGVYPHRTDLGENTFVHEFLTAGMSPALKSQIAINGSKNNTDASNVSFYLVGEDTDYRQFYDEQNTPIVTPDGVRLPLAAAIQPGDSGSGFYGFNKLTQQWELIGFVQSGNGGATGDERQNRLNAYSDQYTLFDPYFKQLTDYQDAVAAPQSDDLVWQQTAENTLLNDETLVEKHKDLYIDTDGTLTLATDIDQKSGSIYVGTAGTPTTLTITGDGTTHTGGGIYVGDGSQVDYQVGIKEKITVYSQLGQTDEYLAKLGGGTLTISGQGDNLGGISVGDGTVVLDKEGQAAKYVELVSGRGQVILNRNQQVKNEDFRFGHLGGTLDLNGQSITTNYLHNVDRGAKIVNNNDQADSTLVWRSSRDFVFGKDAQGHYAVIGNAHLDRQSGANTANYINLGKTTEEAEQAKTALLNSQGIATAFAGQLGDQQQAGKLNVVFDPTHHDAKWLLTGGSFVNELTANRGTLILAGRPTPRAFDHLSQSDFDPNQNTWLDAQYTANTITARHDATVKSARGASTITANLVGQDEANFDIGFMPDSQDKLCVRSDYHGLIECQALTPTDNQDHQVRTTLSGDVTLNHHAKATLLGSDWTGAASGTADTQLTLNQSLWQMSQSSTVGKLTLNDAIIKLGQNGHFNTLTVLGDLTGKSQIHYRTNIKNLAGDKMVVHGKTAGTHTLHIENDGVEPAAPDSKLILIETKGEQDNPNIMLASSTVDLGAYRYTLGNDAQAFYLYNPELDKQAEQERLEAERLAKLEEEKRLAEEAEKARLAQLEKERLEQERLEAERLAAEKVEAERLETERLAKLEEEKRLAEEAKQAELARQKAEQERLEAERLAKEAEEKRLAEEAEKARLAQLEKERLEVERLAKLEEEKRLEAERLAKEAEEKRLAEEAKQAELARQKAEQERLEAERLAKEAEEKRLEAERLAKEAEEKRLAEEKTHQEQLAREEAERLAKIKEEKRLAEEKAKAEQAERERLEAQRLAKLEEEKRLEEEAKKARLAQLEKERLEAERLAKEAEEKARQEQLAREEAERLAKIEEEKRLEAERLAKEAEEKRLAEEKAKAEQAEREKERLEAEEKAKAELARQKAEQERLETERLAKEAEEKRLAEEAEKARLAQLEKERLEAERLAKEAEEKRLAEEAEKARLAQLEKERLEAEEKAEAERLETERLAKLEEEKRLAEEKAKAEQAERERLEAERLAREEAERLAKIEEEKRLAEEKARQEELARQKAEQERLEAERLAKIEEEKRLEAERLAKEAEEKRLAEEAEKARLAQLEKERLAKLAQQKQAELISRYTNAALSDLSSHAYGVLQMGHHLSQTLRGDLSNIWLHADHSQSTHQSELYRPFERTSHGQQIGLSGQADQLRYGVVVATQDSQAKLADAMHAEHRSTLASIFAKYQWQDTAVMIDVGVGRTKTMVENIDGKRNFANIGLGINHQFGNKIIIVPSVYVRHHQLDGANYQLNGANITLDDTSINQIGGDVQIQTDIKHGAWTITPSIGVGYQQYQGKGVVTVNGHQFEQRFGDGQYANVGVQIQQGAFGLKAQLEQHHGDEIDKHTQASIRLGYTW